MLLTVPAITCSVGGTGCNLITDMINRSETKTYISKIEQFVSSLQNRTNELQATLENYHRAVNWLMEKHELDKNSAAHFVKKFAKSISQITALSNNITKGAQLFEAAGALYSSIQLMKSVGKFSYRANGMSYTIIKPLEELTKAEIQAIKNYAPVVSGTASVGKHLLQGTLVVVTIGVTV